MTNNEIIKFAKGLGIESVSVSSYKGKSQSVSFENGVFTKATTSITDSFTITGFFDGIKLARTLPRVDETSLKGLLEDMQEVAKYKTKELEEKQLDTRDFKYPEVTIPKFVPLTLAEGKQVTKELVKKVNSLNDKIIQSNTVGMYGAGIAEKRFTNSFGTDIVSSPSNYFTVSAMAVAKTDDGRMIRSYQTHICKSKADVNVDLLATELIEKLNVQMNEEELKNGDYEIVFDHGMFESLFGLYLSHLNARTVIDKKSVWSDKLGKKIMSDKITFSDNPLSKEFASYRTYDADGFPTKNQNFIEKGVLKRFLHNAKTAELLKQENTGNSIGQGADFSIGIIEPGDTSDKQIIESTKNGVLVTSLSGLHSGVNTSSGDFSVELNGNIIKDGVVGAQLKRGVLSGNFLTGALQNIEFVGNNIKYKEGKTCPMVKLGIKLPISA